MMLHNLEYKGREEFTKLTLKSPSNVKLEYWAVLSDSKYLQKVSKITVEELGVGKKVKGKLYSFHFVHK